MNRSIVIPALILFVSFISSAAPAGVSLDVAVDDFQKAFSGRERYISNRYKIIDSLERLPLSAGRELEIGKEWSTLQVDSALAHLSLAESMAKKDHDHNLYVRASASICALLPHKGAGSEAFCRYADIDTSGIDNQSLVDYHSAGQELCFTLIRSALSDSIKSMYQSGVLRHSAALCGLLPAGTPAYDLAAAHMAFIRKHNSDFVAKINDLLDNPVATQHQRALADMLLARHYERMQNQDSVLVKYHMFRSAAEHIRAGDMRCCIPAYAALLLGRDGSVAGTDALHSELTRVLAGGSTVSVAECAPCFSFLAAENADKINRLRWGIVAMFAVISVLAVILVVFIRKWYGQANEVGDCRKRIGELRLMTQNAKDLYFTQFLNVFSAIVEHSDEYLRKARRKLTGGQIDELRTQLKGSLLLDGQYAVFYDVFDAAFLHAYPDFVFEVNKFLLPGNQLDIPQTGRLTTELRIAAFASLGVDDSARVARFLNLSLASVYTYRNKLRSKAINRASFFSDLRNLTAMNGNSTIYSENKIQQ